MPDVALDLRYLRYAILVAQHGSFRSAALGLNLSQSTVSRRVQLLERRLGVSLFERFHSGVRLTSAGQRFIQDASEGAAKLLTAIEEARATHRGEMGHIRIGLMISLTNGFLSDLLAEFRAKTPQVDIIVEEVTSDHAAIRLLCDGLDVAFLPLVSEVPGCGSMRLWEERLFLAASRDHPISDKDRVNWEDIRNEVFLVPAGGAGAELDLHFLDRFSRKGQAPRISAHSVGRENLLNMIAGGFGVSLVLSSTVSTDHSKVSFVPLGDIDEVVYFSLVWPKHHNKPAVKRLIQIAARCARKQS